MILRQYLQGIHKKVQKLAGLEFAFLYHPCNLDPETRIEKAFPTDAARSLLNLWNMLQSDLRKMFDSVQLEYFHELARSHTFLTYNSEGYCVHAGHRDPLNITMIRAKYLADNTRRKHPEVRFLRNPTWKENSYKTDIQDRDYELV